VSSINLNLKLATELDASFILNLRTDESRTKYISPISNKLEDQIAFIRQGKRREFEKYFIVLNRELSRIGTIRIYNVGLNSFVWGSWIFLKMTSVIYPVEAALMIYKTSLDHELGKAFFDVRKSNKSVLKFHEKFGARVVDENESDVFFELTPEEILKGMDRYSRFLPRNLEYRYSNLP
jgi:hypothetical protein